MLFSPCSLFVLKISSKRKGVYVWPMKVNNGSNSWVQTLIINFVPSIYEIGSL